MIHRLHEWPAGTPLAADLCIIGSGAAGLTLASEFLQSRWRVLVLESGEARRTPAADDMNVTLCEGLPHRGGTEGRARVFGGATTAWGGQLIPLRGSETARREWVPGSGWPLTTDELAPYYRRAERLLGMDGPPYDDSAWARIGVAPPHFDPAVLLARFSQWAPLTRRNFAVLQQRALERSQNVDVMLGATVVGIDASPARNWVQTVRVRDRQGTVHRVSARHYALCAGGIETPRLLLAAGLANRSGTLGRYFQDHISVVAAELAPANRATVRQHFEPRYRGRAMYTAKIEPTDATQQRLGLLNCMAHVKFEIPDALGLLEVRQMMHALQRGQMPVPSMRALAAMARGGAELSKLALGRLARRRRAPSRGAMYLMVDIEQAPNAHSRITLSDELDSTGLPRAVVDWRLTGQEWHTLEQFVPLVQAQWQRAGLGAMTLAGTPDFQRAEGLSAARDIFHHMGTARMSESADDGVVNPQLRCHDVGNLHIAGSAVFPAGGIANPTFTILALTVRLADQLKQRLMTPRLLAGEVHQTIP